jgi:hypothetical protein
MSKKDPAKLTKVSTSLPFGIGKFEWEADPTERKAAWSLYIELVTRVTMQPLEPGQGLLREALTSLHGLFEITRQILKEAGPTVGAKRDSVGGIAIMVLNRGVRPFLSKWHPELQVWENQSHMNLSPFEHEQKWPKALQMHQELEVLRLSLEQYAEALAAIAGLKHDPAIIQPVSLVTQPVTH